MTVSPRYPQAAPGYWVARAACAGSDVSFFPEPFPQATLTARTRAATDVCADCPVRAECLRHALEVGEEFGVWGGLSASDRRHLYPRAARRQSRPRNQPIEHGTPHGYQTHRRRGEPTCLECRLANAVYHRDRRNGAA